MTPQEAAIRLREWYIAFDRHGKGNEPAVKEFLEIADMLEDLAKRVPRWISVEERLPEDGVNVLVYGLGNNENSTIAMTSYTHRMYGYKIEGWCSPWQYFFHEYKITHWMPLPESPEEGES